MRTTAQPDALTARRVDEICDRFERAWRGGKSPRIETHLQDTEGAVRGLLLRELLLLEIDLRLESTERPAKEEYLERFPSEAALIEEIFQELTQSHPTAAATTIGAADSSSTPPAPAAETGVPPELETFGDYDVLEQLGCGGMGVVYRARQRSANRIVALKLIRQDRLSGLPGSYRKEIVDRFHNEALATASLDHDHIVTVYEVGEIDGQHFFSMQYVGGPTLYQVLAKGPMRGRDAAKKLIPVARALHAAHQRGVLHRDVNPRNLLVDPRDNRLLVADFGLAKLREADVALTQAGTTFGSPPYMAPEQVRDAANVTEAADIYGLGATLYMMLTGRPPFQAATVADTLCQVLAEQPAAPRELNPAVDRDLDTISMKCLEKDPARRYASAEEVAEELERFVRREPIRARPIGPLGRFARWCRRNPTLAAVVIVSAVLLTIAATVATAAAFRASAALRGEMEQRKLAEDRRRLAEDRYRLAESRLDRTLDIMDGQMRFLWENPAMKSKGLEKPRREQLQRAADLYDELVTERPNNPGLLADQATAHYRLADISDETGQSEKAEEEFQTALGIQQRVCRMAPANDAYKRDRAESFAALGRLYRKIGEFDKAEGAAQEALQICLKLSEEDPENRRELADSYAELGDIVDKVGSPKDVLLLRAEEFKIRDQLAKRHSDKGQYQRDLAACLRSLADAHWRQRESDDARRCYEAALKICRALDLEESPENHDALAQACSAMGVFYQKTGRPDEAVGLLQEAQKIMDALAEEHRDVPRYRSNQALGLHALADVCQKNQRLEEAESALQSAIRICRALVNDYPRPDYRSDLARVHISLGTLYADTDRIELAQNAFEMAAAELATLLKECPKVREYGDLSVGLSETCRTLGERAQNDGALEEACRWYATALDAGLKVEQERPQDPEARWLVMFTAYLRAELLGMLGRHADALADWELAIERAPPERLQDLQMESAVALAQSGDHAAAAAKAEEILSRQAAEAPGDLAVSAARVLAQAAEAAGLDADLDKPTAQQQREMYLSKAIDYLRKAHRAGFFEGQEARERLRSEPDLDPLREHDDFRKLLEEIGVDPDAEPQTAQPRVARGASVGNGLCAVPRSWRPHRTVSFGAYPKAPLFV